MSRCQQPWNRLCDCVVCQPAPEARLSQPAAEPSDTEMLDWCEWVQAKYPRLANDGMTPLTREDIRAAMREQTECAIRAAMRKERP